MDEGHDSPVPVAELVLAVAEILGGPVEFTPMGELKTVADATGKFLITESDGSQQRVVLCSPHAGPDLISRAMAFASELAIAIGERLSRSLLLPQTEGSVRGCSFAVVPCYSPLAAGGPLWKP